MLAKLFAMPHIRRHTPLLPRCHYATWLRVHYSDYHRLLFRTRAVTPPSLRQSCINYMALPYAVFLLRLLLLLRHMTFSPPFTAARYHAIASLFHIIDFTISAIATSATLCRHTACRHTAEHTCASARRHCHAFSLDIRARDAMLKRDIIVY